MEWQPVRISRNRGHWNYNSIYSVRPRPYSKDGEQCTGKIIRVRIIDNNINVPTCGGIVLEIHPDDAKDKLGFFGNTTPVVCEHQILAD